LLRSEEIEALKEDIKRRKSTVVLGRRGVGKTWLLLHMKGIYVEYPGMKLILSAIVKQKDIYTERDPRYLTIAELLDAVRPKLASTVLLLDEFDDARKPVIKLIEKLVSEGATIIAAGERKPWSSCFRDTLALKPLSRVEAEALVCSTITETDPLAVDIIVTKSLGYPGKIVELAKAYKVALENGDVNPRSANSVVKFFTELRPEFPDKIDILPVWSLFVLGFGALAVKVFLYDKGDWHDAYLFAAVGYAALIVYKMASEGRRRH